MRIRFSPFFFLCRKSLSAVRLDFFFLFRLVVVWNAFLICSFHLVYSCLWDVLAKSSKCKKERGKQEKKNAEVS